MRFLLQFRGLHNDLRLSEFMAVLSMIRDQPEKVMDVNLTPTISTLTGHETPTNPKRGPAGSVLYGEIFFYVELKDEKEALLIASHCVLLRAIYVPCAHGTSYQTCIHSIDTPAFENALAPLRSELQKPSFRCFVEAFGKKYSLDQQLDRIHKFTNILKTLPGRVRMKHADHQLWIIEDAFPMQGHGTPHGQPRQVFLARKIADGQKHVGAKYTLKKRKYIGPTSMDAELSFVMANMAGVKEAHLVNDPFCGTGSILVACAVKGAHVIGGDINILTLRGKGQHTINSNFEQYGCPTPMGIVRADLINTPLVERNGGIFDAIVCDPPYGIKEGMKAFRDDYVDASLERNHFQGTQRVRFVDFLAALLRYATSTLVPGGRLVYWLPTTQDYAAEDVPANAGLRLIANNEQPLTTRMSRRLITMERVTERERERNEDEQLQTALRSELDTHTPAHVDLAYKLLRQPERAERLLQSRQGQW